MAEKYPYVMTADKFKEFVSKLKSAARPDRVDRQLLKSMGFASSNHRRFPDLLKFIGLIGEDGAPKDRYTALREGEAGRVKIASYIREAFGPLFQLYPDADRKDTEALRTFFRAQTNVGDVAVNAMVASFRALCSFGSFEEEPAAVQAAEVRESHTAPARGDGVRAAGRAITVNINIHLDIPPTADRSVYDALFSSMAEHLGKLEEEL